MTMEKILTDRFWKTCMERTNCTANGRRRLKEDQYNLIKFNLNQLRRINEYSLYYYVATYIVYIMINTISFFLHVVWRKRVVFSC